MNLKYSQSNPDDDPEFRSGKIGVLLVNLGTPDGTDKKSMRRYLKEFLSDPRVVETPRLIWWPILNGYILNTRPAKSGKLYEAIWDHDRNESPLRTFTRFQCENLAERMQDLPNVVVDWAMRYGTPSMAERLETLQNQGCDRILVFPLYPQYAASSWGSVNDKAFEWLTKQRWMPALRTVPPYYNEAVYIDALAGSIESHFDTLDFKPERIIASYHGIPKSSVDKGDPYYDQCQKTTQLLREKMGVGEDFLLATFQSRFGPAEWLQPYTDETVRELAKSGVKNIAIFTPGFVADCLETLEEIAGEVKLEFIDSGGENFSYIPCLNDGELGINVIEMVTRHELQGWV